MGTGRKPPPTKEAPSGAAPVEPAWRSPVAVSAFVVVAGLALAADLLSKHYAFASLLNDPHLAETVREERRRFPSTVTNRDMLGKLGYRGWLMPGVRISLSTNPGVVFGLPMPRWAVACATVLTIALVAYFFASADRRAWPLHLAMALILAGALGNLYDRMFSEVALPGFDPIRYEVRDFIDCSQIPLPFGFRYVWVFNVADAWLVTGVALLLVYWVVSQWRLHKAEKAEKGAAGRTPPAKS